MRECKLSIASYKLLQGRVVGATTVHGSSKVLPAGMVDPRLMQAPFDDPQNPPVHVVFRHSSRALLSYQNASRQAERLGRPLYVVFAQDSIAGQYDSSHTGALKDELLQMTNFVNTGYLPSCMFVYIGMHVLLQKMHCQKLGLSKCCEAVVEHIHFSKAERAIGETRQHTGPIVLTHMPDALVLRAVGASWTLPLERAAIGGADLTGVFQLQCDTAYFDFKPKRVPLPRGPLNEKPKLRVRRLQFPIVPADRVVHSAQGSEMPALVLDMACPPGMDKQEHWLACLVMLSRAITLGGLLITRLATLEELNCGPPPSLRQETARLHAVELESFHCLSKELHRIGEVVSVPSAVKELFTSPLRKPSGHPSLSTVPTQPSLGKRSIPLPGAGVPPSKRPRASTARTRGQSDAAGDLRDGLRPGSAGLGGCSKCDSLLHSSACCPYYQGPRENHADATSRGQVPHITQVNKQRILSLTYKGTASGRANNCLIDTYKQLL